MPGVQQDDELKALLVPVMVSLPRRDLSAGGRATLCRSDLHLMIEVPHT
jgi:hypothetical protein